VALSLVSPEENSLLLAIEKLLKYTIPRRELAEFPQYALKRSLKTRASKDAKEATKAKKAKEKSALAPALPRTPKRKKPVAERPAPKTGRRGSRQ
jgi:ATP-dependent RNA helicase RhlE